MIQYGRTIFDVIIYLSFLPVLTVTASLKFHYFLKFFFMFSVGEIFKESLPKNGSLGDVK